MNAPLAPPARRRAVPPPGPPAAGGVLRLTEAAYLARERDPARAEEPRSELFANGEVREMSGVKRPHGLLVGELHFRLRSLIDPDRFEVYSSDMKFRPPRCRYFYPDDMVTPSPPRMPAGVDDIVLNPLFVAEVLSNSTEAVDRGEKQDCYLNTPSVLEYWLIAQDAVRVERHHRDAAGGAWRFEQYADRTASVPLPALGGAVRLAELYRQARPAG